MASRRDLIRGRLQDGSLARDAVELAALLGDTDSAAALGTDREASPSDVRGWARSLAPGGAEVMVQAALSAVRVLHDRCAPTRPLLVVTKERAEAWATSRSQRDLLALVQTGEGLRRSIEELIAEESDRPGQAVFFLASALAGFATEVAPRGGPDQGFLFDLFIYGAAQVVVSASLGLSVLEARSCQRELIAEVGARVLDVWRRETGYP